QHRPAEDETEAGRRDRQLRGAGLSEADRSLARRRLAPRPGEHRRSEIDAGHPMTARGEFQAEKAGAAAGIKRIECTAPAEDEIEDAVPGGALGRGADAVTEAFIKTGRPPTPMRGDVLLDEFGLA